MINGRLLLSIVVCVCGLAFASSVRGEIYSFTDEKGVIHFTNHPVDQRYVLLEEGAVGKARAAPAAREKQFDEQINHFADLYRVEAAFVKAVIKAESNFNPSAISSAGAIGLMQLMPQTAEILGVENPYNPRENINGGVKYLGLLLDEFGSHHLAAAAYNAGENNVKKYGGIPPFNQTQNFVKVVMVYYRDYQEAGFGKKTIYTFKRNDGVTIYTNRPWAYQGN